MSSTTRAGRSRLARSPSRHDGRSPDYMRPWVIVLSAASVPVTLTHAIEDFSAGVSARFGLALLPAAFLLSLGYAAQVIAAALTARADRRGDVLNLLLAAMWLVAALVDHTGDVLLIPTAGYRAGVVSKGLEVGIVIIATLWAAASFALMRSEARKSQPS